MMSLKTPGTVYAGSGSLKAINKILTETGAERAAVVTDKGIVETGLLKKLTDEFSEAGISIRIFDEIVPEPSYLAVQEIVDQVKEYDAQIMIAIGGGSVMDTAKLCASLKDTDADVKKLLENPQLINRKLPLVMIPTTCGTGSEATCNAIVAVPEENLKVGIVNMQMIPDYVILDPDMIRRLPKKIVAATGVDALAHVVECYTSNKATLISDTYAKAGAELIFKNIKRAYECAEDMEAKKAMMLGAYYGGIAITGSGTTAVHALSYPLGGRYHIPHGVSNAILFEPVMRMNKEACRDRLADLCDAVWPELSALNEGEKADHVIEAIAEVVRVTEIPSDLSSFGVSLADLDELVEAGSGVKRLLNNNKKQLTKEEIREIYRKVLK